MANLTPEQLARLRQMMQQGGQAEYYDLASGQSFMPTFGTGRYEGENFIPGEVTGFRGYNFAPGMYSDNFELNGTQYDQYNAQGENTGQGTWEGLRKNSAMDTLAPFAMAALPFALSMFPSLGAAASFGTNPVLSGASATGAAQALGAGGAAMGAGGAAGAGSGAAGGSGAFLGEGVASGVPAWDAAATGAGLSLSGAGAGLLSGASKWLGPAATALGALAGSQGQKQSESSVKSMDPRMDALFYGDLAPRVQGLLSQQMGDQRGWQDMQNVGRGLLSMPVAGNGFSRFSGR